jgi:hypothetical protein
VTVQSPSSQQNEDQDEERRAVNGKWLEKSPELDDRRCEIRNIRGDRQIAAAEFRPLAQITGNRICQKAYMPEADLASAQSNQIILAHLKYLATTTSSTPPPTT